ncbi:MAG TPA: ParB/RepB/Spo0J family partition protein [Candidatus Bathyarchaeia archaeon]|nr:ParB/RepB/Spo0J family partition protein [Candidatus Bathyarchaeia archaeon]HLP47542.1 ParB/RepB/Spo0J family partition protein [Candidatus Kapabacteria bacterium]
MTDKKIYADVKMIPIDSIKPSPFENANEFSEELFASLKSDIETNGLVGESLIVNPKDMTLINGHHRLRAMKELGYAEAPCIFYEPADETEHKLLSIAWNRKRGTFNEQRLHNLIKNIHDSGKYSLEELAEKLGFNNSEIREKLEAIQIDEGLIRKLEMDAAEQEKALPVLITFSMSKKDAEVVEEALAWADEKTRGKALFAVCAGYLHYKKD